LYAPGYPKSPDPNNDDSAIPTITYGQPQKDIKKRNLLNWNDDNLTYVKNALKEICVSRTDRNQESWHNIDLASTVRVMAGKKKGIFDQNVIHGTGNPYSGWINFKTKNEYTYFPARVRCPAERTTTSTRGADIARDRAREPLDIENARLFAIPLNPGYCPRKIVMRAEFEGRGRGKLEYELRSSGRDPIFRRLSSLERKPNNRFFVRHDQTQTFNTTTDLVYWIQTIGDPGSNRSGPVRVSIRCDFGGGDSGGELTIGN
jgi:hypothetical protein